MANVISFDIPKDEITFSEDVSIAIVVPRDAQDDEASTTMITIDEKRNGIITKELEGPNGDPEYGKCIPHVSGVKCSRSSEYPSIFDMTVTLSNGSKLHYPYVYVFTVCPFPELQL
jgi:hypothetical protein